MTPDFIVSGTRPASSGVFPASSFQGIAFQPLLDKRGVLKRN